MQGVKQRHQKFPSELTACVLSPNPYLKSEPGDSERVCYSGDYVKMGEDGFLSFVGRRDTMTKSSGFLISPSEVEETPYLVGNCMELQSWACRMRCWDK